MHHCLCRFLAPNVWLYPHNPQVDRMRHLEQSARPAGSFGRWRLLWLKGELWAVEMEARVLLNVDPKMLEPIRVHPHCLRQCL